ncbi:MAG: glycine/betaine ABC transporter substrate-binding protein [Planctomycetes bacterium]|nr:glycine/betaine ABC transporter substrate-binding protein [Planctomycetota bacterium]
MPLVLLFIAGPAFFLLRYEIAQQRQDSGRPVLRMGCKNFSEQLLLGEIMARMVEQHSDMIVERVFNLGGTSICHKAMLAGEIDLYAEYSGTALAVVLKAESGGTPNEIWKTVTEVYRNDFDLEWLSPLGFNNTYTLTVRNDDADDKGWSSLSNLAASASSLKAGFTSEFLERKDGYPGLRNRYDLEFGEVVDLDPSLMYEACRDGQVDVICAFATDGRIEAYNLKTLKDDRAFFPPYHAAPVIRSQTLEEHPELRRIFGLLAGRLDDDTMRGLNREVSLEKRAISEVAQSFIDGFSVAAIQKKSTIR